MVCIIEQNGCHANIWYKDLKIFSRTKIALRLNLGIQHLRIKVYHVCSNDETGMTFDLFRIWSNLCPSCCGNTGRILHLRVCKSYFYHVSESWPMGPIVLVLSLCIRVRFCIWNGIKTKSKGMKTTNTATGSTDINRKNGITRQV